MDIDMAALRSLERDKGIPMTVLIDALREALLNAYEKSEHPVDGATVEIEQKTGRVQVLAPETTPEGEVVGWYEDTPEGFGRVAASTARQVIIQRLRAAEDEQKFGQFSAKEGDIVTGVVQADRDSRTVRVDLGPLEAIMPPAEQVPNEDYPHGARIKVYVVSVRREPRGPQVVVSRTHPNLVQRLFRLEVPEIASGVVEIKAIAREAGFRTKIAVLSHEPHVSAKGACIGPMGQRVRAVMNELNGEKIDIIDYSPDGEVFVAEALSPAKVTSVRVTDNFAKAA
ncbi:MAG: transcription termination factor NusA, partial [Propioniciclava sp.]